MSPQTLFFVIIVPSCHLVFLLQADFGCDFKCIKCFPNQTLNPKCLPLFSVCFAACFLLLTVFTSTHILKELFVVDVLIIVNSREVLVFPTVTVIIRITTARCGAVRRGAARRSPPPHFPPANPPVCPAQSGRSDGGQQSTT